MTRVLQLMALMAALALPALCQYGRSSRILRRACPELAEGAGTTTAEYEASRGEKTITPDVISVTALTTIKADHGHGESGASSDRVDRAKSLQLKILPISCWAP